MGVGMRDTTRHISHRRHPVSAPGAKTKVAAHPPMTRSERVDLLRRLVAAGQYPVNPRVLAGRIMSAAGIPALEE
jgi:Anti-sigma-28 factor, FlgM